MDCRGGEQCGIPLWAKADKGPQSGVGIFTNPLDTAQGPGRTMVVGIWAFTRQSSCEPRAVTQKETGGSKPS